MWRRLVRRAFSSPTRLYDATRLCGLRKAAKPYRCLRLRRTCSCMKDQGWILPKWTCMIQVHILFCVNTTKLLTRGVDFTSQGFFSSFSLCDVDNISVCVYLQCHIFVVFLYLTAWPPTHSWYSTNHQLTNREQSKPWFRVIRSIIETHSAYRDRAHA